VPIGAGRQRALLALLLLNRNQALPTDRLIYELWGERPPATAVKILQNAVSQLRRTLSDGALVTEGHGYALMVEPGAMDVDEFERAIEQARTAMVAMDAASAAAGFRRALALWRGAALGDLASEPFARAEAARLEERRAVDAISDTWTARGRCSWAGRADWRGEAARAAGPPALAP